MSVNDILVMPLSNPGCGRSSNDTENDGCDHSPSKGDIANVLRNVVLEEHDRTVKHPCNCGNGRSGMNPSEVLEERGNSNTPPKRCPLMVV
jgi:hypothetical protein